MNKNGPVIIIEDDEDDRLILTEVFEKLKHPNKLIFFNSGQHALDFLLKTEEIPFIILSDINLPILSGFDLRNKLRIDAQLAIRCIPYLYLSTSATPQMIMEAYSASSQGFFMKGNTFDEVEKTIGLIMDYWKQCTSPASFTKAA
jgi:CheY-like chemotaxis protein